MSTDQEESTRPEWLTVDFIENALKCYSKGIKVLKISSHNVDVTGKSFVSILYKVSVEVEENNLKQELSLFIKVHPDGEDGVIAQKNALFEREICVYTDILPKVNELLRSINDSTKISPKCYCTKEVPVKMLIFEDLNVAGFKPLTQKFLNLEHILLVTEKLAKLHACGAFIASKNPNIMESYLEGPISSNPERQDFLDFFPANMKSLADIVSQWEGYEEIAAKLYLLEKTILQKAVQMYEVEETTFKVFNLGDLWANNILFKYDDNLELQDVVLVDYQLAYFGSPAIDLNYLLFSSINESARKVHFKFIIREYHRHLKVTLDKLKYEGNIPTLRDIHIEIIKKSLHAVIAAVCLAPLILMETNRFTTLEGLFDRSSNGDLLRKANIENPVYIRFIQKTLKEFDMSGFLD